MTAVVAFVAGVVFALGLGLGGMTQPSRVLAFLDVAGRWDPSLAFVMLAAVTVYAIAVRFATKRARPVFGAGFALPTRRDIDAELLSGSAIFGVGWGLAGLCPGPAVTALGSGSPSALLFVTAMLVGMALAGRPAPVSVRPEIPA